MSTCFFSIHYCTSLVPELDSCDRFGKDQGQENGNMELAMVSSYSWRQLHFVDCGLCLVLLNMAVMSAGVFLSSSSLFILAIDATNWPTCMGYKIAVVIA